MPREFYPAALKMFLTYMEVSLSQAVFSRLGV
jgi:hypothetical protein